MFKWHNSKSRLHIRIVHQQLENNLLKISLSNVIEEVSRHSKNLISDHNVMRKDN